jgi:hypothetical protein
MRGRGAALAVAWVVSECACASSSGSPVAAGDAAVTDGGPAEAAADAAPVADAATDAGEGGTTGDGAAKGAWGQPCTVGDDTTCATGLFCLQGPAGGTVGFCTKTCPATSSAQCPGTPPGTAAFCVVTTVDAQGDKGCAFACKEGSQTYACPGALTCETTEDPPGSGQYLCLP